MLDIKQAMSEPADPGNHLRSRSEGQPVEYGAHHIAPNIQHEFGQRSPIRLFAFWLQINVSSCEVKPSRPLPPIFQVIMLSNKPTDIVLITGGNGFIVRIIFIGGLAEHLCNSVGIPCLSQTASTRAPSTHCRHLPTTLPSR